MKYALDMIECRWQYNGDAIRIGVDGVLLDGQHRLHACVESDVCFLSDVVKGLPLSVLETIDIGDARKASDIANIEGIPNAGHACALAYLVLVDRRNGIERLNAPSPRPTKPEIMKLVREDDLIAEAARRASQWGRNLVAPRIMTFCYYKFMQIDRVKATEFYEMLISGENMAKTHPVLLLREKIFMHRAQRRKFPTLDLIALFYRAWNAHSEGRPLRALRWRTDEDFPVLKAREGRRKLATLEYGDK
jgi:hypothetical protein